jgi:hypothetical protein
MKKVIIMTVVMSIMTLNFCKSQKRYSFELAKEVIVLKGLYWYEFPFYYGNSILRGVANPLGNSLKFWEYNKKPEKNNVVDSLILRNQKSIGGMKIDNMFILNGYFNLSDEYVTIPVDALPYSKFQNQDTWAYFNGKSTLIKSFPVSYSDKNIAQRISTDKRYLIFNPYYAGIDIQAEPNDNFIYLYDLKKIRQGIVEENKISCDRCYNTYEMNDTLIFGKEFIVEERSIEFTYSNIYKAPMNNINDTTLLARNIELLNITPDGKYILGKQYLYGKSLTIILDVALKKYQYIIGRNYHLEGNFYSYQMQKFAFDFGTHFVYVEFPDAYPYDAMIPYKIDWYSDADDKAFWEKHILEEHQPLK